jgi:hypothetical protein
MRTVLSTPHIALVRLVVPLFAFVLLRLSFFLQRLARFLSRRLLRGSVRHDVLHSLAAALGSLGCRSQGGKELVQCNHRHAYGGVANSVRHDQRAPMEKGATGVDDIGHVAVLLSRSRAE